MFLPLPGGLLESQGALHSRESRVLRARLDGRCVSSVSETGPDTPVYPVYLTVTKLLLMRCVSSVSEAGADTQCIWCIWGPQPVYLPSRVLRRLERLHPVLLLAVARPRLQTIGVAIDPCRNQNLTCTASSLVT